MICGRGLDGWSCNAGQTWSAVPGHPRVHGRAKTIEAPCRHGERGLATLDDTSLDVTTNFVPRASCGQPKVTGCVSKWCDFQNGSVRRRISRNTLVEATIRARPGDLVRLAVPKLCREPHSADSTVKLVKLGVAVRTIFFSGRSAAMRACCDFHAPRGRS